MDLEGQTEYTIFSPNKFSVGYSGYILVYDVRSHKSFMGIGDCGLGIGDWGLGIGPNPQSPIPNPQSPIPIRNSFHIRILL